jgi:hypothetical protein
MNYMIRTMAEKASNQSYEFHRFFNQSKQVLANNLRIYQMCYGYIFGRREPDPGLINVFKGFASFHGYLDSNGEIDESSFINITEKFLKDYELVTGWDEYFNDVLIKLKEMDMIYRTFFGGYKKEFAPKFSRVMDAVFGRLQHTTDVILLLGLHKYIMAGPYPASRIELYRIGEIALRRRIDSKHRLLDAQNLMIQFAKFRDEAASLF